MDYDKDMALFINNLIIQLIQGFGIKTNVILRVNSQLKEMSTFMMANGLIILKKGLVWKFVKKEESIQEYGSLIRDMVKVSV